MPEISGKVGKGCANKPADVKVVQELLIACWSKLDMKSPLSLAVTGNMDQKTLDAIRGFQSRALGMSKPDLVISPGKGTINALNRIASSTYDANDGNPNKGTGPYFPFPKIPPSSWTGGRAFGAWRSTRDKQKNVLKFTRLHAGCDLLFPMGTPIYAVADGIVIRREKYFYEDTNEVPIYHKSIDCTVRYGEITPKSCNLYGGTKVYAGQKIATVGKLKMLHLEVYKGNVDPKYVDPPRSKMGRDANITGRHGDKKKQNTPFYRLKSVTDPAPYLKNWQKQLPQAY